MGRSSAGSQEQPTREDRIAALLHLRERINRKLDRLRHPETVRAEKRRYIRRHPEKVRAAKRRSFAKITPSYCRVLLNMGAPVRIPLHAFPPQLLAAKRVHLQLKRLLREVRP